MKPGLYPSRNRLAISESQHPLRNGTRAINIALDQYHDRCQRVVFLVTRGDSSIVVMSIGLRSDGACLLWVGCGIASLTVSLILLVRSSVYLSD